MRKKDEFFRKLVEILQKWINFQKKREKIVGRYGAGEKIIALGAVETDGRAKFAPLDGGVVKTEAKRRAEPRGRAFAPSLIIMRCV